MTFTNKLLNSSFLLLTLVLALCTSCEKDNCDCTPVVNPEDLRFPIHYRFINDLDSDMKAINLESRTVFPIENKTNFSMKTFENIGAYEMVELIVDKDDIAGYKGYIGCATQMEITTHFMINDTLEYVATWRTRTDTIRGLTDSLNYFYWPKDTIYCEKTFGHYYDRSN